jgi:pyruvate dehydrogenase E2 component (dihydrolipoamide acetyltransferase)
MAHEIVMPQLSISMDSGQIIRWLKENGEQVRAGDLLVEVESDKSIVEVEAVQDGVLHVVLGPEAGEIPVGVVIGYLLAEGEAPPTGDGRVAKPEARTVPEKNVEPDSIAHQVAPIPIGVGNWPRPNRPPSSPAARRRARELGADWRMAVGTGPGGRIKERDVLRLAASGAGAAEPAAAEAIQISPVAQRLAELVGLDVYELARQHPGKRLERADVERAIRQALGGAKAVVGPLGRRGEGGGTEARRQPISTLRRLIAERMSHSAHTTAPVTLTTEADATDLVKMREGLKADALIDVVPSYNTLLAKLVATALMEHPDLNTSLSGSGEIVYHGTANIGIAVDTERGLVVPVMRDAQDKSIRQLTLEINDLLSRASEGKALPDELAGGTFTITNLGYLDIDAFTPIINPPECAILGIGRLLEKMVVIEGEPAIRTMVSLSLTFDHRLVDGAPAGRFLQRIKQFIEQPYLWLM